MEQVYIYVSDEHELGRHLTTLTLFRMQFNLFKSGVRQMPKLKERQWRKGEPPVITNEDNELLLVPATLGNLTTERYSGGVDDPAGLLGWAIAQDLYKLIQGHLEKRVSYGELRRAVEVYKEVTE